MIDCYCVAFIEGVYSVHIMERKTKQSEEEDYKMKPVQTWIE